MEQTTGFASAEIWNTAVAVVELCTTILEAKPLKEPSARIPNPPIVIGDAKFVPTSVTATVLPTHVSITPLAGVIDVSVGAVSAEKFAVTDRGTLIVTGCALAVPVRSPLQLPNV